MTRLDALSIPAQRANVVVYSGSTLSGLSKLMAPDTRIIVTSPALEIDSRLSIDVPYVTLDLGETRLVPPPSSTGTIAAGKSQAVLVVTSTHDVRIEGGVFDNIEGALIQNAAQVVISNLTVRDAPGYGVVVGGGSHDIVVTESRFTGLEASAVAILPQTRDVLVENNIISRDIGHSNQQAGILVTARTDFNHIGGPNFLLIQTRLPNSHNIYINLPRHSL